MRPHRLFDLGALLGAFVRVVALQMRGERGLQPDAFGGHAGQDRLRLAVEILLAVERQIGVGQVLRCDILGFFDLRPILFVLATQPVRGDGFGNRKDQKEHEE